MLARKLIMTMKINAVVIGYGPQPDKNLALVQVSVEFDRPDESMTMKVLVPNEDVNAKALTQLGIEKAQSLARRFGGART
jgi:hypothetical protein